MRVWQKAKRSKRVKLQTPLLFAPTSASIAGQKRDEEYITLCETVLVTSNAADAAAASASSIQIIAYINWQGSQRKRTNEEAENVTRKFGKVRVKNEGYVEGEGLEAECMETATMARTKVLTRNTPDT